MKMRENPHRQKVVSQSRLAQVLKRDKQGELASTQSCQRVAHKKEDKKSTEHFTQWQELILSINFPK